MKWAVSPRSLLISRPRSNAQECYCPELCTHHQSRWSLQHLILPHTAPLEFHILLIILKQKERCLKHHQLQNGLLRTSQDSAQFCQKRHKCSERQLGGSQGRTTGFLLDTLMSQAQSYQHPRSALNITERKSFKLEKEIPSRLIFQKSQSIWMPSSLVLITKTRPVIHKRNMSEM